MKEIYLDNSATTALSDAARQAIAGAMEVYGNPSSLHSAGQAAHALLEESRKKVAATFGVRSFPEPGQILFTSCGSEADNLAVLGTAYAKSRRRGGRIVTTDSEHAAVENAMRRLEAEGFEVVRISTKNGVLDMEQYERALNDRVFLVSMMTVNNETGARYDVERAFALAKAKNPETVTHTDAVQGYLKYRLFPQKMHADLVSVSGHKIHAPKGVGALYVSPEALRRRDLVPWLIGGGQEAGFRSGTENLIGIAAFAAAAEDGFLHLDERVAATEALRAYTEEKLASLPVRLHIPAGARAPHVINLEVPDVRSETVVHELSAAGICISSGSACASHAKHFSASLAAFGLPEKEIDSSVRVSFGDFNRKEDADALVAALGNALERLVRIRR